MDITLHDFTEHVDRAVAARGEEYYERGSIISLKEARREEFVATVRGRDTYRVRVLLDGDDILETSCDCPYNKGSMCKHVVATLCSLRDGERNIDAKKAEADESVDAVDEKVRMMSREDLVSVVERARRGEDVNKIVKTTYADNKEWEDKGYVKRIVRDAVDRASDRYGGISYGDTLDAVDGATDVLGYAEEFESARPRAAAICCEAIIEVLSPILMHADDSDGDINGTISEAFELLGRIAHRVCEDGGGLRKELFAYVLKEWPKKKYEGWDCPLMFLQIAADLATNAGEEKSLEYALLQFSSPRKKAHAESATLDSMRAAGLWDDGSFDTRYRREQAAELQVRALLRLHPDLVDDFLYTHVELYPIRKQAIERAITRGDIAQAKRFAEDGVQQAEKDDYPGHVSYFLDALMRCAEREGDMKSACDIAIEMFLDSHMEPFSYYRRAKQYAGAAWGECRAKIITTLSKGRKGRHGDAYKLADVYIEEEMWSDLLTLVQHDPHVASIHGKRLEKRFPREIAQVYAANLEKDSKTPSGRASYQAQCDVLRKIRQLGGPELTDKIVKEWREKYPRRRALMEELDHLTN